MRPTGARSLSTLALALALRILISQAQAMKFDFLELRLPSPSGAEASVPAPFYLVFPDTLGPLAVRAFLEADRTRAQAMLAGPVLRGRALTPDERHFLAGLRALSDGRPADAHGELASAVKGLSPRLKDCLRIDAALLFYLSGMPEESEKEWRRALGVESGGAEEGAWRNLYSLYLARRDFAKAHLLVDEALQAKPGSRWANMAKGFLLRMLGTEDQWEGYLRNRSSWKDSLHGIQIAYGKFLADQGQWEEAVRYYNRGLEGSPGNGPAWLELADAYHRLGYLVFAEQCIQSAFHHGISNPYVFELYGKVLIDFSELADTAGVLQGLGFRLDSAWASRQWRRAEKIVEDGFPKDLHSRSMAQLLYRLYCRNGRVEAARNLKADFWFHFSGPALPAKAPRLARRFRAREPAITPRLTYVTYPLVRKLQSNDFFEFF